MEPKSSVELAHDLKNLITALRMGCTLVEQHMKRGDLAGAENFLSEMRKELESASGLVQRVRDLG